MKRLVMISDIHGCADAFIALLEKLDFNNDKDQLILLGDYGHTRTIELHGKPDIWFQPDKIGIDGGCAYGLQLNALTFLNGVYTSYRVQA